MVRRPTATHRQQASLPFRVFFCCFLKCCNCCSNRYKHRRRRKKRTPRGPRRGKGKGVQEPLLTMQNVSTSKSKSVSMVDHETGATKRDAEQNESLIDSMSPEWRAVTTEQRAASTNVEMEVPQVLMIDGKAIEIQFDYHSPTEKSKRDNRLPMMELEPNVSEPDFRARIDCDPNSMRTYYQFDY